EGMDRHTYWILPLHILTQAAWYKVLGFSLLTLRWLSICWGAVILFAWYALMYQLSQDHKVSLLTVGLIALDDHFISVAALGRMDAMCAGLGWAGCAAFVCLRQRWLHRAIFAGNALVAASCFTHPCGALYFAVLSALTVYYDRALLLAGTVFYVLLMLFEGLKSSTYLVHTLPIATALLAASIFHYARADRSAFARRAALAASVFFVGIQLAYGLTANLVPRGQWDCDATLSFLRQHTTPSSQIVGGGELAFELGFDANLIDDPRMGYYSGKRSDFIVANNIYRGWFNRSRTRYPEIHGHIQRLLTTSYREVFHNT